MTPKEIEKYILSLSPHIEVHQTWGETAFFFNRDSILPKGVYFATIKQKDGKNDSASNLDREGVFRLNVGLGKEEYVKLYGATPKRPSAGGVVDVPNDFTSLNCLFPHPVYAWMGWVSILNPSKEFISKNESIFLGALNLAEKKFSKRKK